MTLSEPHSACTRMFDLGMRHKNLMTVLLRNLYQNRKLENIYVGAKLFRSSYCTLEGISVVELTNKWHGARLFFPALRLCEALGFVKSHAHYLNVNDCKTAEKVPLNSS
jgi:hypothetical protein